MPYPLNAFGQFVAAIIGVFTIALLILILIDRPWRKPKP